MKALLFRTLALLLSVATLGSCSAPQNVVYLHPLADLSLITKVAVLPFGNIASNQQAHEWVRQIVNHELLAQSLFETVEPWEVNRALAENQLLIQADPAGGTGGPPTLSPEDLAELGQTLNAQAFLVGDVLQFDRARFGNLSAPEIGISLRLLDVETGIVIWSATASRSGIGFTDRLVGADGPDLTAAASELVRELLATLATA